MKQALIVVDYQNDFVDGALGFPKAKELEEPICQKIEQARKEGAEVIFTFDTHGGDYLSTQEGRKLPVPHCMKNSEGWQLYGRVVALKEEGDRCFDKPCFGSWELGEYARQRQFDKIELCGVVSNICCFPTRCCSRRRCRRPSWWWTPAAWPATTTRPMRRPSICCRACRSRSWVDNLEY